MSKINFTRRTFLEKEEVARFQKFLADSPSENAIIGNTSKWGILRTDFQGDTDFLVEPSANAGRIKIEKPENRALTSEGLRIFQEAIDNIQVTNDNSWYWVRISHQYVNWEDGVISVNQDGEMVGSGTKFLEVLRGQGTQVPVKIRFAKLDGSTPTNSGFYEIVDVTNDTNAILTSAVEFQNESDLKVVVVGTTPIGETVTVEQEEGIYSYDNCKIELVAEVTENEAPTTGFEEDKTFYIARVKNDGGFVSVEDKRVDWWEFNVVGLTDKLSVFENLADVQNADTALANLGVNTVGRNIVKLGSPGGDGGYMKVNSNGTINVWETEDLAAQLHLFNDSRYLRRNQNLSGLTDNVAARTNLHVYSKTEIDEAIVELFDEFYTQLQIDARFDTVREDVPTTTKYTKPDANYHLNVTKQDKTFTLSGRLDVGSGTGLTIGTIPAGFRPDQGIAGGVAVVYNTSTFTREFAQITVATSGTVQIGGDFSEDTEVQFQISWINQ